MTRKSILLLVFVLNILFCTGTDVGNPAVPEGVEFLRSQKEYLSSVEVSPADRKALEQSNRVFALEMYRELAATASSEENLFFSPYSISVIMAMTYAGTEGQTASQLASALKFALPKQTLHQAMNHLSQRINRSAIDSDLVLQTLNATWLQKGYPVKDSYLDILSQQYDSGIFLVDFENDAEGSRRRINQWVYQQTEERIDELFAPDTIDSETVMALNNTVFLSAPWEYRFDRENTSEDRFTLLDRGQVTVDMMSRNKSFPFAITHHFRAVELPYHDSSVSMLCILPNEGEFEKFESELDDDRLTEIIDAISDEESLFLTLPKFSFESDFDLKDPLQGLGMADGLCPRYGDFSGIISISEPPLCIDSVVHKTYVAIDEEGTIAAAATGEILIPESISPSITLDRPFLFLIWDHNTRTILFLGRLVRPKGQVIGQAPPLLSDEEAICRMLDECPDSTLSVEECTAGLGADDSDVIAKCADCLRAERDLCATHGCLCDQPICTGECPSYLF